MIDLDIRFLTNWKLGSAPFDQVYIWGHMSDLITGTWGKAGKAWFDIGRASKGLKDKLTVI